MTFDDLANALRKARLDADLPLCLDVSRQIARVDTLESSAVDYVGVGVIARSSGAAARNVMVVRFSDRKGGDGRAYSILIDDLQDFLSVATAGSVGGAVQGFLKNGNTDDGERYESLIEAIEALRPCKLEPAAWLTAWNRRAVTHGMV